MASDTVGNLVVIWDSLLQDGSGYGVFGQRYSSSGPPHGPEFRVNTDTTDDQDFQAVASDASGSFVVVWMSCQDGSNFGIFGQRYSQMVPVELTHFRVE